MTVFNNLEDLNVHVLSNQHQIYIDQNNKRSSNDAARIHLVESLKTANITNTSETTSIFQQQQSYSQSSTTFQFSASRFVNYFNFQGWALRVRKPGHRISEDVKEFIM